MVLLKIGRVTGSASVVALLLTGCAGQPKPARPTPTAAVSPNAPKYTATPDLDPQARAAKMFELLNDGQPESARVEAQQLLREQPDNASARSAIEQIDNNPKALLGEQSYSYEIKPGETLQSLAERFLGDRNKFYALAKLNSIAVPSQASAGETIQIPGVRKAPPPPPRPRTVNESTPRAPEAPVQRATDPRRATALRSQALLEMNKGKIDQAVALLRQASELDPANAAISGDLARALRIQAATHH